MITDANKLLEETGYRVVPTDRKRILHHIDKYPYIEINWVWYDDDEYPDDYTWFDVEGMGYGWIFLHHKPKEYREFIIKRGKKMIEENKLHQKMGIIKDDDDLIFAIPSNNLECLYVVILSNKQDSKYLL